MAAIVLIVPAAVNLVHVRRRRPDALRGGSEPSRPAAATLDALVLCALLLSAGSYYEARHGRVRVDDVSRARGSGRVAVEATVVESRARPSGPPRVVARVLGVAPDGVPNDRAPASGLAWLAWPEGCPSPRRGDRIRAEGSLKAPDGPRNPAAFDFRRYLGDRGIHAVLSVDRVEAGNGACGAERLGAWIRSRVNARLGPGTGALMLGLLLGETGTIDPELVDALRATGTVHVTAVSGLHVGFIVLIGYTLLRTARVPPRPARLLVLPVLVGFVLVVGPRASVLRASVTAASLIVATSLERRVNPLNALGVAALALIIIRPGVVFDLGFELSFAAATGITLLFDPFRSALRRTAVRLGRAGERVVDALAVSGAAQVGVAPVLVAHFGEISIAAPLANLVIVPAAAFGVSSGIAMLVAEALAPPLVGVFAASAWSALRLIEWVAVHLGGCRWASAPVAAAYWPSFLAAAVGLRLSLGAGRRVRRLVAALTLATVIGLSAGATLVGPGRSYARAVFFDVGQGDSALLEIPWRRYVLVDAGPAAPGRRDAGRDVVAPYLRLNAIRRLDAVVVTHGHDDHYGGVEAVLGHARAGELILPAGGGGEPCLADVAAAAGLAGADVREVVRGETVLALRRATVTVLGPPREWRSDPPSENDRSVVLSAVIGGARMLLTGDIEGPGEKRLVADGRDLTAEVLKIPHHGSSSSSTAGLIDAVRPALAVCSVGARNRHGHPDPAVIGRFETRGARVLRTDRDGAVMVAFRHGAIRVRSVASGRTFALPVYRTPAAALGPTSTVTERSGSITRLAAARMSSADTEPIRLANRSP